MFFLVAKHAPESCPSNNERSKKAYVESYEKGSQLMKKHDVKLVGAWATGALGTIRLRYFKL